MTAFDYTEMAELYPSKSFFKSRQVGYRRFDTAAEAVRFAIEDLPAALLRGSLLEVGEKRFEGKQIRALYDDAGYPLTRRNPA